jgi:hypothetical protein
MVIRVAVIHSPSGLTPSGERVDTHSVPVAVVTRTVYSSRIRVL